MLSNTKVCDYVHRDAAKRAATRRIRDEAGRVRSDLARRQLALCARVSDKFLFLKHACKSNCPLIRYALISWLLRGNVAVDNNPSRSSIVAFAPFFRVWIHEFGLVLVFFFLYSIVATSCGSGRSVLSNHSASDMADHRRRYKEFSFVCDSID